MFSFSVGKVVSIFLLKVDHRAEQCSGKVPGTGYEGEHEDQERNIVYSDIKDWAAQLHLSPWALIRACLRIYYPSTCGECGCCTSHLGEDALRGICCEIVKFFLDSKELPLGLQKEDPHRGRCSLTSMTIAPSSAWTSSSASAASHGLPSASLACMGFPNHPSRHTRSTGKGYFETHSIVSGNLSDHMGRVKKNRPQCTLPSLMLFDESWTLSPKVLRDCQFAEPIGAHSDNVSE